MQFPVSPTEYKASHYCVEKVTPAITVLNQIDKQALGYDEEAWLGIQEFLEFLGQIRAKNQAVIDSGDAQYKNRPKELINLAGHRLNQIPMLISREQKVLQHKHSARDVQVAELEKKNFSMDQIDRIIPPVPQSEIDHSDGIVASLKAEAEAIQKFLADAPRYEVGLLAGTSLLHSEDSAAA